MLGKTAGGLYWMFRYLERGENTARLVDAGLHIALTHAQSEDDQWDSLLETTEARRQFEASGRIADRQNVLEFLLSDRSNPSSVLSCFHAARTNARLVRTAITREVWESVNETWLTLNEALSRPIIVSELPDLLALIRRQNSLVRGALHGTMLRNDTYDFCRLGSAVERADNTSRILDVKYYVLLPTAIPVGSPFDNVQWESVLRSVSGQRAYRWLHGTDVSASGIADFLIFDTRMPRSLMFSLRETTDLLASLETAYAMTVESHAMAKRQMDVLDGQSVKQVIETGLHEFLQSFRQDNASRAVQIEQDFRF
ncbi:MAG: alpha-E domain-containing protein [Ahrensia sp.]|nr:alpha-E domain-containing protein [Ahrensia sp.]